MQGKRVDRVAHLIQMEISRIIVTKSKDPRLTLVTVTQVKMAPDLKNAFVYFSVLGDKEAREGALGALQRAAGFFQKEIASALKLRYTPRLEFRLDESLDKSFEIDKVIREIHKDDPSEFGEEA